jgi:hypothetical protein
MEGKEPVTDSVHLEQWAKIINHPTRVNHYCLPLRFRASGVSRILALGGPFINKRPIGKTGNVQVIQSFMVMNGILCFGTIRQFQSISFCSDVRRLRFGLSMFRLASGCSLPRFRRRLCRAAVKMLQRVAVLCA